MNTTLKELDAELGKLQVGQARLSAPDEAGRRRVAAFQRQQTEDSMDRRMEAIGKVKAEADQLEKRLTAMRTGGVEDTGRGYHQQTVRGLEKLLVQTQERLRLMLVRAKEEARLAGPKVARCRVIESGGSDAAADEAARIVEQELEKEGVGQ